MAVASGAATRTLSDLGRFGRFYLPHTDHAFDLIGTVVTRGPRRHPLPRALPRRDRFAGPGITRSGRRALGPRAGSHVPGHVDA